MDASTLEFPKSALSARRPDGMIEYALYSPSNDEYKLIWEAVINGERRAHFIFVSAFLLPGTGQTIDDRLESGRAAAIAHFQQLEAGPEPQ